ncbi:MAG: hypothetical protein QXO70_02890, partial [Candidatus Pacearchaeota archaeon]
MKIYNSAGELVWTKKISAKEPFTVKVAEGDVVPIPIAEPELYKKSLAIQFVPSPLKVCPK